MLTREGRGDGGGWTGERLAERCSSGGAASSWHRWPSAPLHMRCAGRRRWRRLAAVAFNALLVSVFAAHHSVFAREGVKRWLARRVPERLLRSVYVWTASLLLLRTCAAWRPIGHDLFHVGGARVWLLAAGSTPGGLVIVLAVRGLDPLELAGIRHSSLDSRAGDQRSATDDSRAVSAGAASALSWLDPHRLRRGPHDRRPPGVRRAHHGLSARRHTVGGTIARAQLGRRIPALSAAGPLASDPVHLLKRESSSPPPWAHRSRRGSALFDKDHRVLRGDVELLAARLAGDGVVHPDHVVAQLGIEGPVALVGAGWHPFLPRPDDPAHLVRR